MKRISLVIISIALLSSCRDAEKARYNALSKPHIITLYGNSGQVIKKWESTGSVLNAEHSDGYYFEDAETGKLIETTGTLVIEVK